MTEETVAKDDAQRGTPVRALTTLVRAVAAPSGARWARNGKSRHGRALLFGILALGGAAAAYAAGQNAPVQPQDKAAIEAIVKDYLLEHPEVIREAMIKLEMNRVASLVDENRSELETPFASAWEGAEKPEVTLVAFMDYACGYCRATLPALNRLLKEDPGLRIVYHELPIISEGSPAAARVSLYAAEAGKFAAFHHAMYAQDNVDKDTIIAAAREAGLDPAKVTTELENPERNKVLAENIRLAQALEAQGTPMLIVGDQVFYGSVSYETLKAAIDKARKSEG